jgi:hypothetical protein
MVGLFAGHAQRLEDELAALRVRHAYATAKVALWQARADGSKAAEPHGLSVTASRAAGSTCLALMTPSSGSR